MRIKPVIFSGKLILITFVYLVASSFIVDKQPVLKLKFPYAAAGLTERQAAAHLLNRFTYGATPQQVDAVVKMGLENWFEAQLSGSLPEDSLNKRLSTLPDLSISNEDVLRIYPQNAIIVQMAIKDSIISKDYNKLEDKKVYDDRINQYKVQKGLKEPKDLINNFISAHILRAAYAQNQLHEVLTDFWFNHFNVSLTNGNSSQFIPAYERDVIRPNVTGKFDKLLLATAKSPAMLYFLDNFSSAGAPKPVKPNTKNTAGLNENYAREVMELHTLGVDGGYTQSDVTEAARVLTGWTVYPIGSIGTVGSGRAIMKLIDGVGVTNLASKGFIREGDFLFTPTRHDEGEKTVLGKKFPANGGYQEGIALLEMLAHHPSTAKFISNKLAVRFVNDNPPASLINKMAKTFLDQDGDIKQVLMTMVNAPEFWNTDALRQKTKSPFEYAISAVRGLNADVVEPYQLFNWINRMGQRIFYYQAPTGFPDRGQYWINTGALLNRMNFGLALTAQQIKGIKVNLLALNKFHEPESANDALIAYSKLLMPERNLDKTYAQLTPVLKDPDLLDKVDQAAATTPVKPIGKTTTDAQNPAEKPVRTIDKNAPAKMLAQVVGVVVGSPEFQRR